MKLQSKTKIDENGRGCQFVCGYVVVVDCLVLVFGWTILDGERRNDGAGAKPGACV